MNCLMRSLHQVVCQGVESSTKVIKCAAFSSSKRIASWDTPSANRETEADISAPSTKAVKEKMHSLDTSMQVGYYYYLQLSSLLEFRLQSGHIQLFAGMYMFTFFRLLVFLTAAGVSALFSSVRTNRDKQR